MASSQGKQKEPRGRGLKKTKTKNHHLPRGREETRPSHLPPGLASPLNPSFRIRFSPRPRGEGAARSPGRRHLGPPPVRVSTRAPWVRRAPEQHNTGEALESATTPRAGRRGAWRARPPRGRSELPASVRAPHTTRPRRRARTTARRSSPPLQPARPRPGGLDPGRSGAEGKPAPAAFFPNITEPGPRDR